MTEKETEYIAFRESDEIGKEFTSLSEAADFFGIKPNSLRVIASDRHCIKGKQAESWKIFPSSMPIIDVESELERRL